MGGRQGGRVLDGQQPGSGSAKWGEPRASQVCPSAPALSHWPCAAGGASGAHVGWLARLELAAGPRRLHSCQGAAVRSLVVVTAWRRRPRGQAAGDGAPPAWGRGQIGAFGKQMEAPGVPAGLSLSLECACARG